MELEERNPAEQFIGTMADRIGAAARAATIFAEPVERDGITVIPVARARWGFGGGVGHRKKNSSQKEEDGAGGGGGAQVTPIGFIEIKNGEAEFRPIRTLSVPLIIVGGVSMLLLLRQALRR